MGGEERMEGERERRKVEENKWGKEKKQLARELQGEMEQEQEQKHE